MDNNGEKEKKSDNKDENLEAKIQALENRIKELEQQKLEVNTAKNYERGSSVGDIIGSIPGFSGIVKILENTSPEFKERIAETDLEIKHRLETGWSRKPVTSYGLSIRSLPSINESSKISGTASRNIKKVTVKSPEVAEPIFDVFEKQGYIYVIAQIQNVDEKDIVIEIEGDKLDISANDYKKQILLPCKSGSIDEKSYCNGVLQIIIKREDDAN